MSFLYDRDYNVTGTVQTTFDFKPSYGTTVSFSAENTSYSSIDNYLYVMPKGINHLQMTVQMPFENRKEAEATKIASFFENLRGTGYFLFTDPASIYKPINLFCTDVQTDFAVNDIYNIQVNLATDQIASLLNWNGAFITGSNIKGAWSTSTPYSKYDVVRYTGNSTFPSNTGNLYDCFYYCTDSHTSQSSVTPASVDTVKWSKQFFFQPTYPTQVNKEASSLKTELPYSFAKRSDFGLHANSIKSLKLDFKGISDAEARCILHFLINKQGYRRFQYKIPNIYNKFKLFFAPQWSHTFVYKNVNDISVTLVEDPLGKLGGDIDNIVRDGLVLYLDAANTASYRSGSNSWYDLSGGGGSGSLNGAVFNTRRKGSVVFDGADDYFDLSTNNQILEFQPNQKFSVFFWAYNLTYSSNGAVLSKMLANSPYPGWDFWIEGPNQIGMHLVSSWSSNALKVVVDYNYAANANKWVNLGYTYDGSSPTTFAGVNSSVKFYLNGSLLSTNQAAVTDGFDAGAQTINYNPSSYISFRISSRWSASYSAGVPVTLSNVLLYNKMLTANEVLQNFNASRERFKI